MQTYKSWPYILLSIVMILTAVLLGVQRVPTSTGLSMKLDDSGHPTLSQASDPAPIPRS